MSDCSIILVADRNLSTNDIEVRGVEDHCEELSFSISNYDDYKLLFIDEFKERCSRTIIDISGCFKANGLFPSDNRKSKDIKPIAAELVVGADGIEGEAAPVAPSAPHRGDTHENESGEIKPPPGMQRAFDEQYPITESFVNIVHHKYDEYGVLNSGSSSGYNFDPDGEYAPGIYNFEVVLANTGNKSPDEIYNMLLKDIAASGVIPAGWRMLSVKEPEYVFEKGQMGIKFVIQYQNSTPLE